MSESRPKPREIIEQQPLRRTRAENALRFLFSTSYPHHTLANLAVAMAKAADLDSPSVDTLAFDMRQREKALGMTDFIRYIELKREGRLVSLHSKRLRFDAGIEFIQDNPHTHEALAPLTMMVHDDTTGFVKVEGLAEMILKTFLHQQSPNRRGKRQDDAPTGWAFERRTLDTQASPMQLQDVKFTTQHEQGDWDRTLAALTDSLQKPRFHIALSMATLSCHDQQLKVRVRYK